MRREEVTLKKYGDLRNLIVHGPHYPREVLAHPTDDTVALIKEFITAMDGTVHAESTLGRGSKFSIMLRRAEGKGWHGAGVTR